MTDGESVGAEITTLDAPRSRTWGGSSSTVPRRGPKIFAGRPEGLHRVGRQTIEDRSSQTAPPDHVAESYLTWFGDVANDAISIVQLIPNCAVEKGFLESLSLRRVRMLLRCRRDTVYTSEPWQQNQNAGGLVVRSGVGACFGGYFGCKYFRFSFNVASRSSGSPPLSAASQLP